MTISLSLALLIVGSVINLWEVFCVLMIEVFGPGVYEGKKSQFRRIVERRS